MNRHLQNTLAGLGSALFAVFSLCSCSATPSESFHRSDSGSSYYPVGTELLAEVTSDFCETFDGLGTDDLSRVENSYLPKGTVDFCSDAVIHDTDSEKDFRLLRCGRRVYNSAVSVYEGSLPEANSVFYNGCEESNRHFSLRFEIDWKAPFRVTLGGQDYRNADAQNYNISEPTYSFLDITFCYCTQLNWDEEFTRQTPLFSDSEILTGEQDITLRLFLKNPGCFYGWYAQYNEFDELVFSFLKPTTVYPADNSYGVALYDAVILIDAGHGGSDSGAVGAQGQRESSSNLSLAVRIGSELQKIGATVRYTRTDDRDVPAGQRFSAALQAQPDLTISVHRNSGSRNGFGAYYFDPYSFSCAEAITQETEAVGLYRNTDAPRWHYFFLNRLPICPGVLTENGYLSDEEDAEQMADSEHEQRCAEAIVRGICRFYRQQPAAD